MAERLNVRAAVAHLQQKWGYSAPFPERNVCNWLQSGSLPGELVEAVPGWQYWVTTDAAIDAAWQAGSIPPKRGRPRKEEADDG